VAVAVADRLRRTAKAIPAIDPETGERDRRTREQKQPDVLCHWLTSCTGTDLIGLTDGPGLTLDGEPVGAAWVRELAQSEHTVLRRLGIDPAGQVLDTTTSACSLRCLCRRHHNMKSHGHLDERHLDRPMPHVERYTA
jgi:hypothetical protein